MPSTLLDIAKLNGNDPVVGLIEENVRYTPEVDHFPFRTIKGNSYTTGIRTLLGLAAFRAANEGQTPVTSKYRKALIETFILSAQIECDRAVALAYEDGPEAFIELESSGVMRSAMRVLGSQIWYGTVNDSKGFPGLKAATPFGALTSAGDPLTINAAGTTANTASSVYAVKYGNHDVTLIGGNNKAWEMDDFNVQQIVAANGGKITAYVAGLCAWIGLQVGNENSVRRIANLTEDSGKGLNDAKLAALFASFPAGYVPDEIWMSRRSRSQLQASRTVTLFGNGTVRPDQSTIAPLPTQYDGVKISVTDSILNTDAIEA